MPARLQIALGLALIAVAVMRPAAALLEARLTTHILVQYPLLLGGGALIGSALSGKRALAWTAAPSLLGGALALAFWLLPRWIDAAQADIWVDAAKAVTLAGIAGLALGWGWAQSGVVLRGFALANASSMLIVMGWLQLSAPLRLCNAYLLSDQRMLGWGLLIAAAAPVLAILLRAFGISAKAARDRAPARAARLMR